MERIGDYQIVRPLGSGEQGQVHVATPPSRLGLGDEQVALKVFTTFVEDAAFERATAELAAHASAASPHLLRVLDAGLQDSTMFVATELAEGQVAGGDRAGASSAVARAARGAHALHEAGIVHGGIKPSNVLRTPRGAVLAEPNLSDVIAPGQTATGVSARGSLQYLDPTSLRGEPPGRASDVYALGVTLHELLTGTTVHPGLDTTNTMNALRTLMDSPPVVNDQLDPQVRDLIAACVAPDRASRPATALEVADRLDAVAGVSSA